MEGYKLTELLQDLREAGGLNSEQVHNLILDLEVVQRNYGVRLTDARRMEDYYRLDNIKQIKEKVKYQDALKEIRAFPARDAYESFSEIRWSEFYKQDISKLQNIASKAFYEGEI